MLLPLFLLGSLFPSPPPHGYLILAALSLALDFYCHRLHLGTLLNSIAGILGGGIGGQLLSLLGLAVAKDGGMDIGSIIASIASGGVGGGVLIAIIGVIKKALGKK